MNKRYNSSTYFSESVGGGLPFLVRPDLVRYRVGGFEVKNTLADGEKVAAGTPMYIDIDAHEAKFLKAWKIKTATADASTGQTTLVIYKTDITPVLKATTVLMVAPSTLAGTGKAAAPVSVSENSDGNYSVVVTTSAFDTLAANGILVEAAETGSGKAMYCQPNSISCEDLVAGGNYTLVDAPYGVLYAYKNTINPMSAAVLAAIEAAPDFKLVWEKFNETNA